MLIAIDHGNYDIKTPHHSFMAGLAEHSVRPPMADEVLEYGGSYWTLSGKRLSYRRDKTRDESYFILSLFAIAREMVLAAKTGAVERVHLAVGLPPEHYSILKDKFTQYFKRSESIHFIYNDKPLLSYFMDYRDSDIARLLKITSPTVSYRKKQALIQLKLLLEAKHYE